jgi:hypothetical protein
LAEASLGPVVKDQSTHEKLEYIELNQIWNLDSATKEFTSVGEYGVSGKSHLLTEDVVEGGSVLYQAGKRINWGISMTSVRELLHVPVRVQSAVQICEEDVFAKRFGHAVQSGVNHHITLGTLIQSLLWELSWHGTPAERDARRADLVEIKADIDAGTAKTVPYTWGSFGRLPTSEVYPRFFEDVSKCDIGAIEGAIEELNDGESAQAGLYQIFAGKLQLKAEYATLTGRGLQVALDEARAPKAEPSQLLDQYDAGSAYAAENKAWDNMVPVGREFGSPDFERLMEEDAKAFEANLTSLIEECKLSETANQPPRSDEFLQHAINVQTALRECGQEVDVSLAAAVWEHYSASLAASWMSGADTAKLAKKALFLYCSGQPKYWRSFADSKIPTSSAFTLDILEKHKTLGVQNPNQARTHKPVIVLRKDLNMRKVTPPKDFPTWLDYAVATMDARGSYLDRMFEDVEMPAQDEIRAATQNELDRLRQKSVMPWIGILENWKTKLAQRLGRSEEVILEDSLFATDFSGNIVRIQFEDGTDLNFRRAFYLGDTPSDGAIHRVAVFTEHCGYHEFWIGQSDRIEEVIPLKEDLNSENGNS